MLWWTLAAVMADVVIGHTARAACRMSLQRRWVFCTELVLLIAAPLGAKVPAFRGAARMGRVKAAKSKLRRIPWARRSDRIIIKGSPPALTLHPKEDGKYVLGLKRVLWFWAWEARFFGYGQKLSIDGWARDRVSAEQEARTSVLTLRHIVVG